jgi:hypothetical protein
MRPDPERGDVPPHAYDLFHAGRPIGRLEWRIAPRDAAGWYLVQPSGEPRRLAVDAAIDDLARDRLSPQHDWELSAELAAILSTPFALDAADRALHLRPQREPGRFRRVSGARSFELYVDQVDPITLAHAIPELPLESVSDVSVLSGKLLPEAFEAITRRIGLLGGQVVAFRREDEWPE